MYVWIWRRLPGPLAVKLLQTLLLVLAVAGLLLFVVFPWIEPHLPINQVTVPGDK
jgi:hypothetical protein